MKEKIKNEKAITLIALVVTIVVLLILAGVSLNLVLGNNGIITKAQDAKIKTRAGDVEDEIGLWKNDTYLARNTNGSSETEISMLQRLKDQNLITTDDEIDTTNKIIKIKEKDGTIVKEISYKIDATISMENIFLYNEEGIITGIKDEYLKTNPESSKNDKGIRLASLYNGENIKLAHAVRFLYLIDELNGSITIPKQINGITIIGIGEGAFSDIVNLENVKIEANINRIEYEAFGHCIALKSIDMPNTVTNIGEAAFWDCESLKNVTIPNSVTKIEERAFLSNNLTNITIPDSVTSIGTNAFLWCDNLTNITIQKAKDSISGAPWGAENATVTWAE